MKMMFNRRSRWKSWVTNTWRRAAEAARREAQGQLHSALWIRRRRNRWSSREWGRHRLSTCDKRFLMLRRTQVQKLKVVTEKLKSNRGSVETALIHNSQEPQDRAHQTFPPRHNLGPRQRQTCRRSSSSYIKSLELSWEVTKLDESIIIINKSSSSDSNSETWSSLLTHWRLRSRIYKVHYTQMRHR